MYFVENKTTAVCIGSFLLSAGLGGLSNAIYQKDDHTLEKFDWGEFFLHLIVNGLVGLFTVLFANLIL